MTTNSWTSSGPSFVTSNVTDPAGTDAGSADTANSCKVTATVAPSAADVARRLGGGVAPGVAAAIVAATCQAATRSPSPCARPDGDRAWHDAWTHAVPSLRPRAGLSMEPHRKGGFANVPFDPSRQGRSSTHTPDDGRADDPAAARLRRHRTSAAGRPSATPSIRTVERSLDERARARRARAREALGRRADRRGRARAWAGRVVHTTSSARARSIRDAAERPARARGGRARGRRRRPAGSTRGSRPPPASTATGSTSGEVPDPFTARFVWHRPCAPDVPSMRAAARLLVGEHDFASFCRHPGPREVDRAAPAAGERRARVGERLEFGFRANAFLHQMVRALTGTLVAVGEGKVDARRGPRDPRGPRPRRGVPDRTAHGLTLERVVYGRRRAQESVIEL